MISLKHAVGATITTGVLGLTMPASADTFNSKCAVTEIHGTKAANSSSSFAASALMGEQGASCTLLGIQQSSPPSNWESIIATQCALATQAVSPTSVWPSRCNPTGMANTLMSFDPGVIWNVFTSPPTLAGQADALNTTVASLALVGSPAVVPLFGQADHWATVFRLTATPLATPGTYSISSVTLFDGGLVGARDNNTHLYNGGPQLFAGSTWKTIYQAVTGINPNCDFQGGGCGAPPTSDPFFANFLLMFDPPAGSGSFPEVHATFERAPGIVRAGHNAMNEQLAQHRLWQALIAAGINHDPETWDALAGAVPGSASLVNGVYPGGSPWNYYLVPLLTSANTAIALVQLDADDGAFQHIHVFPSPVPFTPVPKMGAAQRAGSLLARGERLTTGGTLTWNPSSDPQLAWSPSFPYYEFGVTDANGKTSTARVMLHDGTAVRGR